VKKITTLLFICCFLSSSVFAGGFQIGTHNARAMGMASAYVGMASDASAIYFNAAGLTNVKGFNLLAGTTLIMPSIDFTGPTPLSDVNSTLSKTFTPINFYAAYGMDNGLSFGIGVYNPYGLGSEYPSGWIGKRLALKTELRTFYINPTIAYKVNDFMSVGIGFSYIISKVQLLQQTDLPPIPLTATVSLPAASNVGINLEGIGDPAFNFNFGVLFKASEDLSLGFTFRTGVDLFVTGDLTFIDLPAKPTGYPLGHSDLFPAGKGKTKLSMPYDIRAGVSYNATKNLTLNADLMFVGWESYKRIAVDFEKNTAVWKDLVSPKDWENTFTLRVGAEYRINNLALRAGYVNDGNPIPTKYMDPSLPGNNRHEFTAGIGYQILSNLRVDAAFQYISFSQEVTDSALPFNGIYDNSTTLFGFNIAYSLK
jgi:long-chain fatty acid transport protein